MGRFPRPGTASTPPCHALAIVGGSVSGNEKSEKFLLFHYRSDQSRFPMRVSDSPAAGDADQVAKIEGENRALVAAEGG